MTNNYIKYLGFLFFLIPSQYGFQSQPLMVARLNSRSTSDLAPLLGKPAPFFVLIALDGKRVSLSDYRGKGLLINFWATWCEACRQEMPWLAQLRDKYAAQGLEVLGVVTDRTSSEKIASVARSYGVRYPILLSNHATAQAYGGLTELPISFFIDRHGTIVAEMTGAGSKQEIDAKIKQVLAK